MTWEPTEWVNDSSPDLEADNLNNINAGIQEALQNDATTAKALEALTTETKTFANPVVSAPKIVNMKEGAWGQIWRMGRLRILTINAEIDVDDWTNTTIVELEEQDRAEGWFRTGYAGWRENSTRTTYHLNTSNAEARIELLLNAQNNGETAEKPEDGENYIYGLGVNAVFLWVAVSMPTEA